MWMISFWGMLSCLFLACQKPEIADTTLTFALVESEYKEGSFGDRADGTYGIRNFYKETILIDNISETFVKEHTEKLKLSMIYHYLLLTSSIDSLQPSTDLDNATVHFLKATNSTREYYIDGRRYSTEYATTDKFFGGVVRGVVSNETRIGYVRMRFCENKKKKRLDKTKQLVELIITHPKGWEDYDITSDTLLCECDPDWYDEHKNNVLVKHYMELRDKRTSQRSDMSEYGSRYNKISKGVAVFTTPKNELTVTRLSKKKSTATFDTIIDNRDGKKYKTVTVGKQTWMAENLNYQSDSCKCWCYNNDTSKCNQYGRLYHWKTAKTVCPSGWRLPTRQDWKTLVDYAGGWPIAGKTLKAKSEWESVGRIDELDMYGFSALPGGYRRGYNDFRSIGHIGNWWTATEGNGLSAYYRYMSFDNNYVNEYAGSRFYGFSVRCVLD